MKEQSNANTVKIQPNERQQLAIDTLKGQIMLLAGPGTGKTFTIINRIEKMLIDGINPSSILCLTFSDAAANEMRQRLIKKLGIIASGVNVYTYHSFCNDVIKENPAQFELAANVRLINETEKITFMKECIDEANLEFFVPIRADKYHFTKNFISYVESIKAKRISKNEYLDCIETNPALNPRIKELESEIFEIKQKNQTRGLKTRCDEKEKIEKNIEKAKELWTLYELYSAKMINNNVIDFSDMINFVLDAFEDDEAFLKDVSNKYKYFLVDEYQDTNDLQNNIIFNLLDGNDEKNIFVVGDDDQIIYGFQGANSDNIENFLVKYPDTKIICLQENNRSTQSILDFSYEVVKQDTNRLEDNPKFKEKNISKKLTAKNEKVISKDKRVRRIQFGESLQELNYIVNEINELVKSEELPLNEKGKKDLSQIAIITKKRSELAVYAELLKGKNIPCQIDEGKSIFSIRSSILIYFYLKALNNHLLSSEKLFGLMLSEPFKLELEDYNKILHEQNLRKQDEPRDFITLMNTLSGWKNPEKINEFLDTFNYLKKYSMANSLRNTVVEIINRTGILECFYRLKENRNENLMGIKKFISEAAECENIESTSSVADFVKYLDESLKNEISINIDKTGYVQNAVQLTTYHGSKGREFGYVYLPNLIKNNWEDFSMPGEYKLITETVYDKEVAKAKKKTELLKLLFVGITRAKHNLTISFADSNSGKAQQITEYLQDFTDYDFESLQFECKEDEFTTEFFRNISRDVFENQKAFQDEIKERVELVTLSQARLNDYLSCPRKFFYVKVLGIDVEEADWDSANFGTIIHSLLENSVKIAKKTGKYPEQEQILAQFQKSIETTAFSAEEIREKHKNQGIKIIESYYPHFSSIPQERVVDIEFSFDGVEVDGHTITGKIDRIEKNSDGLYELYDYKTGNPVSANQIAIGGKKENYYNQLCFYKYAFEKFTGNKVSKVGIIYVEDHTKSVYKVLGKDDSDYIENLIKECYNNINELKFNPIKECNTCKYCQYKQLCKLDII